MGVKIVRISVSQVGMVLSGLKSTSLVTKSKTITISISLYSCLTHAQAYVYWFCSFYLNVF